MIPQGVIIVYFSFAFALYKEEVQHKNLRRKDNASQCFTLIKVHGCIRELPRRKHIDDLTDVRLGTLNQLIDDIGGNFQALPRRENKSIGDNKEIASTYRKQILIIRERIEFASGLGKYYENNTRLK